jgi:hypothetical protein
MSRSSQGKKQKGPAKVRRASEAAAERARLRREAREAAKLPARAAVIEREPDPDRQPGAARLLRDRVLDAAGGPTEPLAQAWDRFERDFEQARFRSVGICTWTSVRIDGGGADPGIAAVQAERRRRELAAVLREVGEPGASALWHVVGMGESLSSWSLRSGWNGGRRIDPRIAKGILIQALAALARVYRHD